MQEEGRGFLLFARIDRATSRLEACLAPVQEQSPLSMKMSARWGALVSCCLSQLFIDPQFLYFISKWVKLAESPHQQPVRSWFPILSTTIPYDSSPPPGASLPLSGSPILGSVAYKSLDSWVSAGQQPDFPSTSLTISQILYSHVRVRTFCIHRTQLFPQYDASYPFD